MKHLIISIFVIGALTMSACSSLLKRVDLTQIQLGMTKAETIQALKKKPDNIVGARQYEEGVLEVVQFSGANYSAAQESNVDIFWLYYFNDRLVEWGKPIDWAMESDRIYHMRNRHGK